MERRPSDGATLRLRLPLDGGLAAAAPATGSLLSDANRARLLAYTDANAALRRIAKSGFEVLLPPLTSAAAATPPTPRRICAGERVQVIVLLAAFGAEDNGRATRDVGVMAHLVRPVEALQLARDSLDARRLSGAGEVMTGQGGYLCGSVTKAGGPRFR